MLKVKEVGIDVVYGKYYFPFLSVHTKEPIKSHTILCWLKTGVILFGWKLYKMSEIESLGSLYTNYIDQIYVYNFT